MLLCLLSSTGADNCTPHGTSEVRHGGHYGEWNERTDRSSSRRVERGEIGVEDY